MVDMVFSIQGGDVRASQCPSALVTQEPQSSEIICFAEGILSLAVFVVRRKELGCHDLAAVLVQPCQHRPSTEVTWGNIYLALETV